MFKTYIKNYDEIVDNINNIKTIENLDNCDIEKIYELSEFICYKGKFQIDNINFKLYEILSELEKK